MISIRNYIVNNRLKFIDFARGLVMILMALDHAAIYWNPGRAASEGLNGYRPKYSSLAQFFTRYVTHYCAPTFIFLAGTALALSTERRLMKGCSQKEISLRMIKRGIILIILEFILIAPVFRIGFFYFGVLACIGTCFIIFSILRFLPTKAIFVMSVLMVAFHPYLDLSWIPSTPDWGYILHLIIHEPSFRRKPWVGLYPIIPWLGVMGLGWCFGKILLNIKDVKELYSNGKYIALTGIGLILAFFYIRFLNEFGNILHWKKLEIIDFMLVAKYPPSLALISWTLGGMMLMLYAGLKIEEKGLTSNWLVQAILTFGETPLFFYCVHIPLYSYIPVYTRTVRKYSLEITYAVWLIGLVVLYFLCKAYKKLKKIYPKSILQYI